MTIQVSTGAVVVCTFGSAPAVFTASSVDVSATTPAGVITDITPANIPTFGICSSPINPATLTTGVAACVPVLIPWAPGSARVRINGVSALDDTSQCMCSWGGVITVTSPGQVQVITE